VAKVDTFKKQVDFGLATAGRPSAVQQRSGIDRRKPKSEIQKPPKPNRGVRRHGRFDEPQRRRR